MADLRGKLKDLEAKHKDVLGPGSRRPGMTASVGGAAPGSGSPRHGHGTAALAAAEYGADAAVPWQPVGKGTRKANPNPERIARPGEDPGLDLTFRPRTVKLSEVGIGDWGSCCGVPGVCASPCVCGVRSRNRWKGMRGVWRCLRNSEMSDPFPGGKARECDSGLCRTHALPYNLRSTGAVRRGARYRVQSSGQPRPVLAAHGF